ncbi:MAG: hypothetical protein ACO1RX_23385 [Candidatus Sericytochromatia bacterium]
MKAIRTKGHVQADHSVVLQLPGDIQPGEHLFILVMEEAEALPLPTEPQWPAGFLHQFAGSLTDVELEAPDDPLPDDVTLL